MLMVPLVFMFYIDFFKDLFIFRDRGKEGERNITVRLPLMRPLLGTWPATQACVLSGNRTVNPLIHRPTFNPLSHTSQGYTDFIYLSLGYCLGEGDLFQVAGTVGFVETVVLKMHIYSNVTDNWNNLRIMQTLCLLMHDFAFEKH